MGGTFGNVNAVKTGARSTRSGLVHAKLGRKFANAYGHSAKLRKAIEAQIIKRFGVVPLVAQAKIQTIVRLEESCRALEKSMCDANGKMTAEEIRLTREAIVRWAAQRDGMMVRLLGEEANPNPWADIDASAKDDPEAILPAKRAGRPRNESREAYPTLPPPAVSIVTPTTAQEHPPKENPLESFSAEEDEKEKNSTEGDELGQYRNQEILLCRGGE